MILLCIELLLFTSALILNPIRTIAVGSPAAISILPPIEFFFVRLHLICIQDISFFVNLHNTAPELCAIIKNVYYSSSAIGIDSIRMLFQFGHCIMTMLFVAMTDAYQKHDLHIRKCKLLNMPSSCIRTEEEDDDG
jgi:hypothetical protein